MFQRSLTRAFRRSGTGLRPLTTTARLSSTKVPSPPPASNASTDDSITVKYPADHELPSSEPVRGAGRAGVNVLPTLATFSLEGKVGVVTGGARGLGLVMGQGLVISGADLAIVDLNKEEAQKQAESIVETFKKDNPGAKRSVWLSPRLWDMVKRMGLIANVV